MTLAIFDLDNTLLAGDSDHCWGEFLCATGVVDSAEFARQNDQFYADYQAGSLDVDAYLRFALGPIAGLTEAEVEVLQARFLRDWVEPMLLPAAFALLDQHRAQGDRLLIITATNTVVTAPIARRLGVETLIGSEAELIDGRYTGQPRGLPSFREGKVTRLAQWLAANDETLEGAWFYSDSHNDLPLLEQVPRPVAVDPDDTLRAAAQRRGWPVISLRD
jgi:HAD superfamily hydrolase (TIGR01490 family)